MASSALFPPCNLEAYRAAEATFRFTCVEDDQETTIDVSGYDWIAQLRRGFDEDLLFAFDVDQSEAVDGVVTITMPVVAMETLSLGTYVYDVVDRDSGVPLAHGKFTVTKHVTRPAEAV